MKQHIDGRCDVCGAPNAKGYWHHGREEPIQACEECKAIDPNIK